ncbi:LuxR C-terminal-related transcriptional regulator [Catellatospora sp. KI3]|uniref:ATP-binding protein n=1 Tax=Catellatospora sp. KI3 TaxID=3041620 RepID=UPI00248215AD|nr:LuxR C-terminal-related transcriptional regulator [Catellatospora sp. KI3]MDI1463403.1 LuxR C-terminal-related transcriptional regulator [Catellatospora sp. KI3]
MVAQGISGREAEVLTLVGEHLSNAEIGARLFISVRTVETHVSSLLRKLGAADRRGLAQLAAEWSRAGRGGAPALGLPAPVTSFIGRSQERAALIAAVREHRQVSAVGPGGVGKTRLALAVAEAAAADFADGVWFVDLVPVTDPAMVGAAVAAAIGAGEQQSSGMDESVVAALADRHALLVLDNCEHVRDGVAPLLERLLAGCPRLTVLATSRARLTVPFERVHPVPPLSLDGDGDSDAVALLLERAAAVGWPVAPEQRVQAAEICRGLDGVALAIELAAARLPALGLDGLAQVLPDQLRLLTGGARADDRHRSVRAMLDWSHALLEPDDRTLLRRIAVFVAPFTVDAARQVAGFAPLETAATMDALARLTEQSLLTAAPSPGGTRYRTLEPIRQYGTEQLAGAGELDEVHSRHLRWSLATATDLARATPPATGAWRAAFDAAADDIRAALGWAADRPEHRAEAHDLALALAQSTFTRNLAGEAQQRYEQAASLADDPVAVRSALRHAAAVAGCRRHGDGMYRLYRAAADVARGAGDPAGTARDLATAAAVSYRFSGTFSQAPPLGEAAALLAEARELAGADPAARAAVALAECGVGTDAAELDPGAPEAAVPQAMALAGQAVDLAARTGDPLALSAALDALAAVQCWAGDTFVMAQTTRRRVELLASVPVTPASAHERANALSEAADTCIGVGDLSGARRWGEQLRDLPLLAERGDFATSRLLVADALAGDVDDVLVGSRRFRDAWERTGSLHTPDLATAAAAVAMVHGLRGEDGPRSEWLSIMDELGLASAHKAGYSAVFDAIVQLHHGRADRAAAGLLAEADEMDEWVIWVWQHWYVALRAEAAVLTRHPDARRRITASRAVVAGNPVADALLDRAEALLDGDQDRLLAAAAAFEAAGCRYQWARTLVLTGGDHAATGAAALADLGMSRP